MGHVNIQVLPDLPPVRLRRLPTPFGGEPLQEAGKTIAALYMDRLGLNHLSGKMTAVMHHLAAVHFTTPDGVEHEGWGAAVGPAGGAPIMVLIVSNDDPPVGVTCRPTLGWVRAFGGGELADESTARNLTDTP